MKKSILLVAVLMVAIGCTPHPRYRTSGEGGRSRATVSNGHSGYTTNQMLRLGKIMRSYLGKPYLGASRYETGVDCSGFVQEVFRKFDKRNIPRTVKEQYQIGREIAHRQLRFGDLVFFNTVGGTVSHVGIFNGSNEFIHSSSSRGVIISSLRETYWAKRYVGGRRILENRTKNTRP